MIISSTFKPYDLIVELNREVRSAYPFPHFLFPVFASILSQSIPFPPSPLKEKLKKAKKINKIKPPNPIHQTNTNLQ